MFLPKISASDISSILGLPWAMGNSFIHKDQNIRNADLANRTGFNSVNTFIRIFKKYEGISPGRYIDIKQSY